MAGKELSKINIFNAVIQCVFLLLALAGDIESNPGPGQQASPFIVKSSSRINTRGQSTLPYGESKGDKASDIDISKTLMNIGQALTDITQQLEDFKLEFGSIKLQLQTLTDVKNDLEAVRNENSELKIKVEKLEENSKRENLLIFGLTENENLEKNEETETIFRKFLSEKLGILSAESDETLPIERVLRLGVKKQDKCRPILVRLLRMKHKYLIMDAYKKWRNTSQIVNKEYVKEDFSERVRNCRRKLGVFLMKIKEDNPEERVSMNYDKLIYEKRSFMYDLDKNCIVACDGNRIPDKLCNIA